MLQFTGAINVALFELIGFNLGRCIARLRRVAGIVSRLRDARQLARSFGIVNEMFRQRR